MSKAQAQAQTEPVTEQPMPIDAIKYVPDIDDIRLSRITSNLWSKPEWSKTPLVDVTKIKT